MTIRTPEAPALPAAGEGYAYDHFRRELLEEDSGFQGGVRPGGPLPPFDLPTATGGRLRLADLAGRPVLLTLGSFT